MINEKILIKTLNKWQGDSSTYAGLKEPALLQKVIDEVEHMAVNEEIKQRIQKADAAEKKTHSHGFNKRSERRVLY